MRRIKIKMQTKSTVVLGLTFSAIFGLVASRQLESPKAGTLSIKDQTFAQELFWLSADELPPLNSVLTYRFAGKNLYVVTDLERKYYLDNHTNFMVMVSVSRHTEFGQKLKQHPKAVAVLSDPSEYYDKVLFKLDTTEERDQLAMAAHRELGVCGAIEEVSLTQSLVDVDAEALPAYWSTSVALDKVKTAIADVSSTRILSSIQTLENLGSRYHAGSNSAKAVETVKAMWTAAMPEGATIAEMSNGSRTSQNNVIVTIPGTSDDATAVIVGAHLDSINMYGGNAPGADDDASGIATLTEMMHVIKSRGLRFHRRIEFHGYAAEEAGLVGSKVVAQAYKADGRKVSAMLQMDMTSYTKEANKGTIFLVNNDTSSAVRRQLSDVIGAYGIAKFAEMRLTAGTSDHKSWTNAGYHAAFPFEHPNQHNSAIHTTNDVSSGLDMDLASMFAKTGVAWVAHNAGITDVEDNHGAALAALTTAGESLKIGAVPGSNGGERFILSAASNASSASVCVVKETSNGSCVGDSRSLALETSRQGRAFFYETNDQTFTNGELHRFTVFDTAGVPLAQRDVRLSQK